jgi:tetratricopeptide (TPR) repeat protein
MTPSEQSGEVQALLYGTLAPDPGEPAGAIKAYLLTQEQFQRAWSRIEGGPSGGEPVFDPLALLDDVLRARRRATALYPMSRHAWQGVGDFFWRRYHWRPRRADLQEAVTAYTRAAELLVPYGTAWMGGRDFHGLAIDIARGLAALSDTAALDAFFSKVKGSALWEGARETYVVALGSLNDPRADRMFREQLAEHPQFPWSYVDYLIDRGRYAEALRLVEQTPHLIAGSDPPRRYPADYARRGALLERLGRVAEAEVEYRHYFGAIGGASWSQHSVEERYRVAGSALQAGMKFHPNLDSVPAPRDE